MTTSAREVTALLAEEQGALEAAARAALERLKRAPSLRDPQGVGQLLRYFGFVRLRAALTERPDLLQLAELAERSADRLLLPHAVATPEALLVLEEALTAATSVVVPPAPQGKPPVLSERVEALRLMSMPAPSLPPGNLSDFEVFVEDARRMLDLCTRALTSMRDERAPEGESVQEAFRALHTLKGNAAFMGMSDFENLARLGEQTLEGLRGAELVATPELLDALLALVDKGRAGLVRGAIPEFRDESERLAAAAAHARLLASRTRLGEVLVDRNLVRREDVELALAIKREPLGQALVRLRALDEEQLGQALEAQRRIRRGEPLSEPPPATPRRYRLSVDSQRLDELIQLLSDVEAAAELTLRADARELATQLTRARELAVGLRRSRLEPLLRRTTWAAQQLAARQGKELDVTVEGEQVELEPDAMEALSDALVHLVRNAVDHGIEPGEERVAQGKRMRGSLAIRANLTDDGVRIEVRDDGRGLDRARIVEKARRLGLLDERSAVTISDEEAYGMIFLPGFTTAERVTDVSGRGVGMDVVKRAVEDVGGSLEISSARGLGTCMSLRLPAPLALRS